MVGRRAIGGCCTIRHIYLAARLREGDSLRGRRGYEIRILKSADGVNYTPVQSISQDEVGID